MAGTDRPSVTVYTLSIRDFRNIERLETELPTAGIAVIGDNAQGKTNFLEAIYYLQILRSAHGARDVDVTRIGSDGFHLAADVVNSPLGDNVEVAIGFDRATKRKKVTIGGGVPPRMSDAFGAVPAVMCSPADAEIVGGPPAARRRFLDVMLAAASRRYLRALQAYRAALAQRNAAVRAAARGTSDAAAVAVWEPALAEHGAVLAIERQTWVDAHASTFVEFCAAIGETAPVTIAYAARVSPSGGVDALREALEAHRGVDIRRGATHTGPHRDDLLLTLHGREMRDFASGGQQRTAALALRVLEALTFQAANGSHPILLLDDPFAELDRRRAAGILALLRNVAVGQTFLCVPRPDDIPSQLSFLSRWTIANGELAAPIPAA